MASVKHIHNFNYEYKENYGSRYFPPKLHCCTTAYHWTQPCYTVQPLQTGHNLYIYNFILPPCHPEDTEFSEQWNTEAVSTYDADTSCKSQLLSGHTLQKITAAQWTHTAESQSCSVVTNCRMSQLLSGHTQQKAWRLTFTFFAFIFLTAPRGKLSETWIWWVNQKCVGFSFPDTQPLLPFRWKTASLAIGW